MRGLAVGLISIEDALSVIAEDLAAHAPVPVPDSPFTILDVIIDPPQRTMIDVTTFDDVEPRYIQGISRRSQAHLTLLADRVDILHDKFLSGEPLTITQRVSDGVITFSMVVERMNVNAPIDDRCTVDVSGTVLETIFGELSDEPATSEPPIDVAETSGIRGIDLASQRLNQE